MRMAEKNNKRKRIAVGLLFFVLFFGGKCSIKAAKEPEKRVLYISSYSYAFEVVPLQMEGIRESLDSDVVLDYQFMDTKNVDTAESEQLFYERIKYFLQEVHPYDVIIVGDDAALNFALKYRDELFLDIPVIFEGVNNVETATKASEDPLICGVIEHLSYKNTLELAEKMYPQATQVVGILDNTVTGIGERTEFYKYVGYFPELEFKEINTSELSKEEIIRRISELGEESILVYIVCYEDGDGNTYTPSTVAQLITDNAEIPTFSVLSIGMGNGFLGGEMVSHRQMGAIAGDMAQQIINGGNPAELELCAESPRNFYFDENVMKHFGIKRSELPDDVEIINHKETFFERHRSVLGVSAATGAVLLFLIGLLVIDNRRKKKLNVVISETNEKLKYISCYDALTSLLNRRVFMEDMERHIAEKQGFSVIMYDLDNFKRINDVYGHNEGDVVLKELAERSKTLIDAKMQIYRLAGDEFIAIVKSTQKEVVTSYAEKIRQTFKKPYRISGQEQMLHSSMGIAMYPEDGATCTELLSSVDKAMYAVKNGGKNGMQFYQKTEM